MKALKISKRIVCTLSIISVFVLFFASCTFLVGSGIANSCASKTNEPVLKQGGETGMILCIFLFVNGIFGLIFCNKIFGTIVLSISYIIAGIIGLIFKYDFDILIYFSIACLIIGIFFIVDTIINLSKKSKINDDVKNES